MLASASMGLAALACWGQQAPAKGAAIQPKSASSPAQAGSNGVTGARTAPLVSQSPSANFDVRARSQQVLAHMNAAIRYYRTSLTPMQKVGEPSDVLYRDQAVIDAKSAVGYAFLFGKSEAKLLSAYQQHAGTQELPAAQGESEKLQAAQTNGTKRVEDLKAQQQQISDQLQRAKPKQAQALRIEQQQVKGELELSTAMVDALNRIVGMSETQGHAGLAGDIERLQRTAPELAASKTATVTAPLESFSQARSAGVSSQAIVLFQLLTTQHAINEFVRETDALHQQALDLRSPLMNIVKSMVQKGQALAQQQPATGPANAAPVDAQAAGSPQANFDTVLATFKALSNAAIPLSQEMITLEQSRANLEAWRTAVDAEYNSVLRRLLLRVLVIVVALCVLLAIGEVWRRVTARYVHDLRRRRQLLGMRRLVVGVLSGLVVLFGFQTQFNSLATFAGFITAGLAVGLQTILLSVAAYFFIVGRYGVRVGDRITVGGVTGDVIEVGLVRFYVMELGGSGTELQPTGRVAVLSNAILFQAGTPLYKQLPGTEYAWHELTAKLLDTADYQRAAESILDLVQKVYEGYRPHVEQQQRNVESWMDARIAVPSVESRLQMVDGGLQLMVRFPVEIRDASEIDEKVAQAIIKLFQGDSIVKQAVTGAPTIKAAVKG